MEFPIPKTLSDTPDLHYIQFIYNKLKSISVESFEGKKKLSPKNSSKTFEKAQLNLLLDNMVHPEELMAAYASDPETLLEITSGTDGFLNNARKKEQLALMFPQLGSQPKLPQKEMTSQRAKTLDCSKQKDTFMRIHKKLENIRRFYPELYYKNQNIIEVYGKSKSGLPMDSDVLAYDADSTEFWI